MRGRKLEAVCWAVLGLGLAVTLPAHATEQEDRYRDCVKLAARDPSKALQEAETWHANGGGGASRHCGALALVGLGRYEDAGTALQQLAEDIRVSGSASPIGARTGEALRADLLSQSGNAWLMAKQYQSARVVLTDALKYVAATSPVARDIYVDRARAEGGDKDFAAALNDLDKAIEIDPGKPESYVYRASALRETHQIDLAESDIETALKLDPGNLDAVLERGYIRQVQKNYDGARRDWQYVVDNGKGSPVAEQAQKNLATLDSDKAQAPADADSHSPSTAGSDSPAK